MSKVKSEKVKSAVRVGMLTNYKTWTQILVLLFKMCNFDTRKGR